jgi:hypothetical protein
MIMLSIIGLGNASYESPPQYQEAGSVTCSGDVCLDAKLGLERSLGCVKLWSITSLL